MVHAIVIKEGWIGYFFIHPFLAHNKKQPINKVYYYGAIHQNCLTLNAITFMIERFV